MPSIKANFSRWENGRAYIDYFVDGFALQVKYYVNVVKWRADGSCHVIATWGFTYDPKYKSKTGYIPGSKINDGDITLTLAVLVWTVQQNRDACWEGEYQSQFIEASTDVYIPKKPVLCTQTFKVIDKLTRDPISGASVTIWESPYPECITGADGKCSISNLEKGKTYNIAVNKTNYYDSGGDYTVCDGEITIELEPACLVIGETRCIDNDLYECIDHRWVLSQANSPECCQTGCEVSCQTGCEISCQETCEVSCQETCELACQTECELGCEVGCEVSCQETCEISCQETCEVTCETACQKNCEEWCQIHCQEICETICETACETGCEVKCQTTLEILGCPVAVVANGTELVDALGPFREFRDTVLKKYAIGRHFIKLYYNQLTEWLSPFLAKHESFKRLGQIFIRGVLWCLRSPKKE